jgi:hypothetical protein
LADPLVEQEGDAPARPRTGSRDSLVLWALVAIGVALRARQFFGDPALFIDEVNLARNIAARSYASLLGPLDFGQVAPPGFLLAERFFWSLLHTDWSLRLVPFAGAIASLFLFRALATRALEGIAVPLAVGAFAVGVPFIKYGGWVKQYSTDVALALLVMLLAANLLESAAGRWGRCALAGLAGVLAVWCSNTAVFVVAGVGAALGALALSGRLPDRRRKVSLVLVPWAVGAAAAVIAAWRTVAPETMAYMKEYWAHGFPTWTRHDLAWPWRALTGVFGGPGLGYQWASVFALLALAGFLFLWRGRRAMALVAMGPVVVTLAAAAAHVYPFVDRLILFLTPAFLIAAAAGAAESVVWLRSRSRVAAAALLLLVLFPPLRRIIAGHPAYWSMDPRPVFESLAAHRRPGDTVFLWHEAVPFLAWYGPRYGLTPGEFVRGGCWWTEPRRFLRDLDPLRGRSRVWLVPPWAWFDLGPVKTMFQYVDVIGVRGEELPLAPGTRKPIRAWLYDFSDSTRLARASADTFPEVEGPVARFHVTDCTMPYSEARGTASSTPGR